MSSARRSASSRYCVVRMMVVPSRDQVAQHVPQVAAAAGVEAGGRLVEEQHLGRGHEAGGEVEPAAHAAREGLDQAVGGVGRGRAARAARRPGGGPRPSGRWCRRPTISRLSRALMQPVDGGLLGGDADAAADGGGLVDDVEAGHRGPALGRCGQRGEDADGRGLAGAVVAEQAEHGAGRDLEVEVAQRPQVAEALAEAVGRRTRAHPRPAVAVDGVAGRPVWRMVYRCSYIVRRTLAVHCTTWQPEIPEHDRTRRSERLALTADGAATRPSTKLRRRPTEKIARKADAPGGQGRGPRRPSTPSHARAAGRPPRRARRVDPDRAGRPPPALQPRARSRPRRCASPTPRASTRCRCAASPPSSTPAR